MFTGIIEALGEVRRTESEGSNSQLWIHVPFADELKIDQSVAHNGVCLTVTDIQHGLYSVTAIAETLKRTNLGDLKAGDKVNIERCMAANARFDGHIVQGHVDDTATCTSVADENGSWMFTFEFKDRGYEKYIVEKGSVCINGISLTVVKTEGRTFSVAIIPYTFEHTNLHAVKPGMSVNIEFDIIGKYIAKQLSQRLNP